MSLIARSKGGSEKMLVAAGSHIGRVDMVVDLGLQTTTFNGDIKHNSQVYVRFELSEEKLDDGRPVVIGRTYTNSFAMKANLRKDVQQMLGTVFPEKHDFNVFDLLGKPAMITVVHTKGKDGKTYANIGGLSPVHKSLTVPAAINEAVAFDLDEYSEDSFLKLPEWLRAKVNRIGVAAKVAGDVDSGDGLEDL